MRCFPSTPWEPLCSRRSKKPQREGLRKAARVPSLRPRSCGLPGCPAPSRLPCRRAGGSTCAAPLLSRPKSLLLQLHDLLSWYVLRPWLIPICYVSCYPEKRFWMVLRSLGASPFQATAVRFLPLLFVSQRQVFSAVLAFSSVFSDIFYPVEIRWQAELQMELNWVILKFIIPGFCLCFAYLKAGNDFSVDNLSLVQPFLVSPFPLSYQPRPSP